MDEKLIMQEMIIPTDENVVQVRKLIRLMDMDDRPPTPNCDCVSCGVKIALIALTQVDPESFNKISDHLRNNVPTWKSQSFDTMKKMVGKYYNEVMQEDLLAALEKKAGLPRQPGEKRMIKVGSAPAEIDGPSPNMRPARA